MSTRTKLIGIAFLVLMGVWLVLPSNVLFEAPPSWKVERISSSRLSDAIFVDRVRATRDGAGFEVTVFRFARDRVRASVVDLKDTTLDDRRKLDGAALAVNGGYFDRSFKPVGLVRIDGVETGRHSGIPILSGWVLINAQGQLDLVPAGEDVAVATARSAFQAGPFLVEPGGQMGIRSQASGTSERTVLATSGNQVLVIVTSPVSMFDLADCLVREPMIVSVPHVDAALNLDGGPSSGFSIDETRALSSRLPRDAVRVGLSFW